MARAVSLPRPCPFSVHFAIESRHERGLAGMLFDLNLVELEPPLPVAIMIFEAVDLDNARPLFLFAFGVQTAFETAPKRASSHGCARRRYRGYGSR